MKAKRILSMVLVLCLCLTMLPAITMQAEAATYDNTHTNTGNQAYDIVSVAQTQLGYQEGANNNNKYGAAFGHNYVAWCAYFVSWCAKEAGISDSIIHRQGIASPFSDYFNVPNTHSSGNYFPKPGDLVFYGPDSDGDHYHVGIVETVNASTGYITTIEGNTNSGGSSEGYIVYRHTRHYQYSSICCYGRPNYTNSSIKHTVNTSYGTNFTAYPKAEITAENIFDANHNQIDSSSCIWTSDLCTIHEVYTDGCCKVTYPLDSGGTKTIYSKISLFNLHTHSFTGSRYYESAHPHAIWQECVDYDTCGGWTYTGEYYEKKTCEQCWYATINVGASSISVRAGESKTVSISISGCWPDSRTPYVNYDTDIVEITIENNQATFTGLKAGTTNFSIIIYSDSTKSHVIGSATIPITVTNQTYTISYNANGGSGAPDSQIKYHNTSLTLSSIKPTRKGYTFLGWATSSTATSASYQPGDSFSGNANTTLYAVWGKGCEVGNHKYVYNVTGRPTLTDYGKLAGECGYCGAYVSIMLPELNTDDYTYKVTRAATCTADGMGRYTWKTTSYGGSYNFDVAIPSTGHSYNAVTTVPTCTESGYTTYSCTSCGDSYVNDVTGALGHTAVVDAAVAATCTASGLTEGSHCDVCGYVIVAQNTVAALGHNVQNGICITCGNKYISITTQPENSSAFDGEYAKITVKATGDGLTYQWYVKDVGDIKYFLSSQKTATYSCKMTATTNGRYAKCKVTDQYGNSVWTDTVQLTVKAPMITSQPATQKVKEGKMATFKVLVNGGKLSYQWQYRTSSSGSWKNASATGNKTASLSVPATVSRSGYQYRCRITDSVGNKSYTKTVSLYVLGIKTQPVSKTVVAGKTAKFTVTATGAGKTYQWQYRTSSDDSWKSTTATGCKTKTLSISATAAKHGYQYRCKITDSAGNVIYTKAVSIYVLGIKTQPVNKTVKAGTTAKFTVKATGKGITYQWQYKTPSASSWKKVSVSSGKTASYSLTAKDRHNGYQYRCKITDAAGNVIYSNIVKLIVK